jgi:protein SCO1/2
MPTFKLILLLVFFVLMQACDQPVTWHGTDISGKMPNLEFNLTGPDGESLDADSLKGKPVLVFFGFTSCPDVCPTTLTQLSVAIKKLGQQASHINVLLVSVDPERDTPAVMKRYTAAFGPWLTGVTGTEEKLATLRKTYGVYAAMESTGEKGTYNVMHSAAVFGFDANGRARLLMTDVTNSDAVAVDLKNLIKL